jgi:protein MON2
MGCPTENPKVIKIALDSLERLISLRAVSLSAVLAIIQTMNDCMSQGVDI